MCLGGLISCAVDDMPKPRPMLEIKNNSKYKLGWAKKNLSTLDGSNSFIAVELDGAVFAADSEGIYKLEPTDGSVISHFRLQRKLSSGIAVSSNNLFVATLGGFLVAVDRISGKTAWQVKLPTIAFEAPQVSGDIVVVRTSDSQLLAYNINDGGLLWVFNKQHPQLMLKVTNSFQIISNQVIAVGLPGGRLALINLRTGTLIWELVIAAPDGATELDRVTDIAMRPVVDDKSLCVASYNGKIACIDIFSRNIIWEKPFSSSQGLVIDEQKVYAVDQNGIIYAFDKSSGHQFWQNNTMQYRGLGIPFLLGEAVVAVDKDGYIHVFDRNDGKEISRIKSTLTKAIGYPLTRNNGVILQANGTVALIKNY